MNGYGPYLQHVVRKLEKMNKLLTIIFMLQMSLISMNSFACICSADMELQEARDYEYEKSEIVIVGEITYLSSDKKAFEIKILEKLKGDFQVGQVLQGKNNYYCEPIIDSLGTWLIYGGTENGKLTINECGLSRSFDKPEENLFFRPPPPPPPSHPDSIIDKRAREKEFMERIEEYKTIAFKELEVELTQLRDRKM